MLWFIIILPGYCDGVFLCDFEYAAVCKGVKLSEMSWKSIHSSLLTNMRASELIIWDSYDFFPLFVLHDESNA